MDGWEEVTTGLADCIVVNSRFTRSVFVDAFVLLRFLGVCVSGVLYPAVSVPPTVKRERSRMFLSVNRYERKKDIRSLVIAFCQLARDYDDIRLVIAGGYDERNVENVEYLQELKQLVDPSLLKSDRVKFLQNISSDYKWELMRECRALVYTPAREHFGIVPLEAMASECIVIGRDSGGPTETILPGITGYLVTEEQGFEDAMRSCLLLTTQELETMGKAGRDRVEKMFSMDVLGAELERYQLSTTIFGNISKARYSYQVLLTITIAISLTLLAHSIM
eukprot:Partr_v1_DN25507_c1_g1_i1_m20883 putative asparagine-linked glycosylation 2, alpha-1,3-mannosyltransferase homolog (S. cerevisiae)